MKIPAEARHLGHPRDQSYGHIAGWEVGLPRLSALHRRFMQGIEGPLIGYLRLAAGQELGQAPIQVLGETLPQSAARRCCWCGSLMACVSSGAVRGVAGKGSVLLEVAVPSLLIIPMDKQEGTGGSHHWNGPAQAIGHD
jgi:hypothetical protein